MMIVSFCSLHFLKQTHISVIVLLWTNTLLIIITYSNTHAHEKNERTLCKCWNSFGDSKLYRVDPIFVFVLFCVVVFFRLWLYKFLVSNNMLSRGKTYIFTIQCWQQDREKTKQDQMSKSINLFLFCSVLSFFLQKQTNKQNKHSHFFCIRFSYSFLFHMYICINFNTWSTVIVTVLCWWNVPMRTILYHFLA